MRSQLPGLGLNILLIAGVIIAVAGIAGLTPFDIVRRTVPVMLLALTVNAIAAPLSSLTALTQRRIPPRLF